MEHIDQTTPVDQTQEVEEEEVRLDDGVVEQICAIACQQFYDLYEKAQDDRIKNHRRTVSRELDKYRLYKRMLKTDMRLSPAEMIEYRFDFIRDLMGDSLRNYEADYSMKKEIDRKKRVQYRKDRIEYAFQCYKEQTDTSNADEDRRRYRIAWAKYIDPQNPTIDEIAESENISRDTAFRDLRIATDFLDVYLCA